MADPVHYLDRIPPREGILHLELAGVKVIC